MPWARQTLAQLAAQISAGFQAPPIGADTALRRSNLGVTAITMAGALDGEYAYIDWIVDNCLLPDSAIGAYADRWGALKGAIRKGPAAATGVVNFAGLVGTPMPQGTVWQLQPGVTFATSAAAAVGNAGTGSAPITAVLPTTTTDGTQWNAGGGAGLTLTLAIPGISGAGSVAAAIINGTAAETDAAFRARYLQLYSAPSQGGDPQDYQDWALELPDITRAWCVPLLRGPGTVGVFFMEDFARAANNGFPVGANGVAAGETRDISASGDQLLLANYLYSGRRASGAGQNQPVTALVYAIAPVAAPINFTFKYVPAAQQSAAAAAVAGVLGQEGTPTGALVQLSDVQAAVKGVPQCTGALVVSPNDNFGAPLGSLPVVGSVTFE